MLIDAEKTVSWCFHGQRRVIPQIPEQKQHLRLYFPFWAKIFHMSTPKHKSSSYMQRKNKVLHAKNGYKREFTTFQDRPHVPLTRSSNFTTEFTHLYKFQAGGPTRVPPPKYILLSSSSMPSEFEICAVASSKVIHVQLIPDSYHELVSWICHLMAWLYVVCGIWAVIGWGWYPAIPKCGRDRTN